MHGLLIAFAAVVASAAGIVLWWVYRQMMRLPENRPERFIANGDMSADRSVVVCAGDSLTQGTTSHPYAEMLARRLEPCGDVVVNAGRNGELSYNLLMRLDDIIACAPAVIVVLIGTNDMLASLNDADARGFTKRFDLPRQPSMAWYRENLKAICDRLQAETGARIALMSPPPVGEQPGSPGYELSRQAAVIVREVAEGCSVAYLPLHERMVQVLEAGGSGPPPAFPDDIMREIALSCARHYLLGRSWDDIAVSGGYTLLCDSLHLNSRSAGMVTDLIEAFVLHDDEPGVPQA